MGAKDQRDGGTMQTSDEGITFIRNEEGVKLTPYHDPAGLLSIGVGHCLTNAEKVSGYIIIAGQHVAWSEGITNEQVTQLLRQDLYSAESAVTRMVTVPLNQHQFDALTSFCFNVGCEAFHDSTLLKLLNQGKYDEVPAQMCRWNKGGGHVLQVLVDRREREVNLWMKPLG